MLYKNIIDFVKKNKLLNNFCIIDDLGHGQLPLFNKNDDDNIYYLIGNEIKSIDNSKNRYKFLLELNNESDSFDENIIFTLLNKSIKIDDEQIKYPDLINISYDRKYLTELFHEKNKLIIHNSKIPYGEYAIYSYINIVIYCGNIGVFCMENTIYCKEY